MPYLMHPNSHHLTLKGDGSIELNNRGGQEECYWAMGVMRWHRTTVMTTEEDGYGCDSS